MDGYGQGRLALEAYRAETQRREIESASKEAAQEEDAFGKTGASKTRVVVGVEMELQKLISGLSDDGAPPQPRRR